MRHKRDFFGEYVAPGLLIGGTIMTANRALNSLGGADILTRVWKNQESQQNIAGILSKGRATTIAERLTPAQLAEK